MLFAFYVAFNELYYNYFYTLYRFAVNFDNYSIWSNVKNAIFNFPDQKRYSAT